MRAVGTNNDAAANGGLGPANLLVLHCPANLYTLWNERKVDAGGNKAAKEFTPKEQGRQGEEQEVLREEEVLGSNKKAYNSCRNRF